MAKKLRWVETEYGPMPSCAECARFMLDPLFIEAVYSVAIDKPGSHPPGLKKGTIEVYHNQGHKV